MRRNKTSPILFFLKLKTSVFLIGLLLLLSISSCRSGGSPLFKSSSKKGPNIYSSKHPRTKSKSKLYTHSISRKKTKTRGSVFSSKKSKYKSSLGGGSSSRNRGGKSSSGGRKSGKGRKK